MLELVIVFCVFPYQFKLYTIQYFKDILIFETICCYINVMAVLAKF